MKLLFPFAKRFIAGYDFDSAKPVIYKLLREGYQVSIDYLGELSKTKDDCMDDLKFLRWNHWKKTGEKNV